MALSISIITPSLNQGRFIERTIKSVLSQKIEDLEYLVCDGGSTDGTIDILRRYKDRLSWVSEKDNGQADAVNKGLTKAKGDIIGWLNSDDIYYADALSTVLSFFEDNPHVNVVYGDADHIDEDDNFIESYYTEDWNYERLKEICFLCQPAVFFRRRLIKSMGMLNVNLNYCMDYEYWLRLGAKTGFVRLDKKLAGSRMYQDNKTLGNRVAVHREINDMLFKSSGKVPVRWASAFAKIYIEQKSCNHARLHNKIKHLLFLFQVRLFILLRWRQNLFMRDIKKVPCKIKEALIK